MRSQEQGWLERLDGALGTLEGWANALLLASIALLGALQMTLRLLFATGVAAFDGLARGALLWLAMLGAAYATQRGMHLAIDVLPAMLGPRPRAVVIASAAATTALVALTLALVGVRFAAAELSFTGFPGLATAAAIPLGFSCIALHSVAAAVTVRPPAASARG